MIPLKLSALSIFACGNIPETSWLFFIYSHNVIPWAGQNVSETRSGVSTTEPKQKIQIHDCLYTYIVCVNGIDKLHMNSLQLWLSTQNPHKIEPINISLCTGEEPTNLTFSWEALDR